MEQNPHPPVCPKGYKHLNGVAFLIQMLLAFLNCGETKISIAFPKDNNPFITEFSNMYQKSCSAFFQYIRMFYDLDKNLCLIFNNIGVDVKFNIQSDGKITISVKLPDKTEKKFEVAVTYVSQFNASDIGNLILQHFPKPRLQNTTHAIKDVRREPVPEHVLPTPDTEFNFNETDFPLGDDNKKKNTSSATAKPVVATPVVAAKPVVAATQFVVTQKTNILYSLFPSQQGLLHNTGHIPNVYTHATNGGKCGLFDNVHVQNQPNCPGKLTDVSFQMLKINHSGNLSQLQHKHATESILNKFKLHSQETLPQIQNRHAQELIMLQKNHISTLTELLGQSIMN